MKRDWIVIEGDNGTGKDTLALSLGVPIISALQEIRTAEQNAKSKIGTERFHDFLNYNLKCAQMTKSFPHSVIIRYWPSTLAGAYADCSISEEEFNLELQRLKKWPMPDLLVLLRCQFDKRIQRICYRNQLLTNTENRDNIQKSRSLRHWEAMQRIVKCFPHHFVLDNTNLTPEETQVMLKSYLKSFIAL
jgi:thymidylate kinase